MEEKREAGKEEGGKDKKEEKAEIFEPFLAYISVKCLIVSESKQGHFEMHTKRSSCSVSNSNERAYSTFKVFVILAHAALFSQN